ncbi:MAG: bifunctional 5,10-methylenetetrahydrofolate dehydrogenase/5,10-methenyltetrahydrofolate cyclohydrolase [Candidatus Neomarinimicrobiota bacterium]
MPIDTILLAGKPVAEAVYSGLQSRINALRETDTIPGLAVVLAGEDPASTVYVQSKTRAFQRLELFAETFHLTASTEESEVLQLIDRLNEDERFHGVLVQLPLPRQIKSENVLERVSPLKDVDGFHPDNLGRLLAGQPRFIPCTPQGILELLAYYKIPTIGRHAVVVGRSTIVGKPMMALLANKWNRGNATVTVCHTGTPDIAEYTSQADLLIVASGQPQLITPEMVKASADIVDVGMNREPDSSPKGYRLVGDVATEQMMGHVHAITPVPGGVGPMTVAMLVSNTVLAAEIRAGVASTK